MDHAPARDARPTTVVYSNLGATGTGSTRRVSDARFWEGGALRGAGERAALAVGPASMEAQILVPARGPAGASALRGAAA